MKCGCVHNYIKYGILYYEIYVVQHNLPHMLQLSIIIGSDIYNVVPVVAGGEEWLKRWTHRKKKDRQFKK